jgi:hypothetical protein
MNAVSSLGRIESAHIAIAAIHGESCPLPRGAVGLAPNTLSDGRNSGDQERPSQRPRKV